jgi:3D (Asp-Asp-Asp) domain-containing protein
MDKNSFYLGGTATVVILIILTVTFIDVNNLHKKLSYNHIDLIQQYANTKIELNSLKAKHEKLKTEYKTFVEKYFFIKTTLTAYTTDKAETNFDNANTAIMQEPKPGWTVAVSRDLSYLLGKTIYIEGIGVRYVNDLMNKRFKNTIDVLMPTKSSAQKFGVKSGKNVVLLIDYK